MTAEKFTMIIFSALIFIVCISIYLKTAEGQKKHLFSATAGSMGLGALGLLAVWLLEFLCGNLLTINLCTVLFSLLGSLPAVAAMLFLNII